MSQNSVSSADARAAAELNMSLMRNYSSTGLGIFKQGNAALQGQLAHEGLPDYVSRAYTGAGTSAYEAANAATAQNRAAVLQRSGQNPNLGKIASIYAGGAKSLQSEQAGLALSKANAQISNRNALVGMLSGSGFQGTDLSTGFGALTNRSLAVASQAPNEVFQGITAGIGFGAPLLMSALRPSTNTASGGTLGFNPDAPAQYSGGSSPTLTGFGF